jgi:phage terminase large subunit-like protein
MTNNDISMTDYIYQHCMDGMNNALTSARYTAWERECPKFSDTDYVYMGLLRCITSTDSGRHFLQNADELLNEPCAHSTYFNSTHSLRREAMLKDVSMQSYKLLCAKAEELGIDYLGEFPELDAYDVEAADGHFIAHACHTPKNENDKVYAAGFVCAMNLRNGFLNPLCKVTNGTNRTHEFPCFKDWIEKEHEKKGKDRKKLYIYDRAAVDYAWWDKQKKNDIYLISILKENAVIDFVKALDFDKNDPVNAGVVAYELFCKENKVFSVVTYLDPETGKEFKFISTLPTSIKPGNIAILYYKRWTIEKAFNNSKSDLKETKAWSSDLHTLDSQMRLIAMTYNLMRLFEEKSKKHDPKLIHPAEAKYQNALLKRDNNAKSKGKFVNQLHFGHRIARISSSTIRAVKNAILKNLPFSMFMEKLIAKLILRPIMN